MNKINNRFNNLLQSLEVWKFGSLEVWKFGSLEVWKFGSLEVWKLHLIPEEEKFFIIIVLKI